MNHEPMVFLNGDLLPQREAKLGWHDAGFVFGATITDFSRTIEHRLFRYTDHLQRFRHDCEACHIPLPFSDQALLDAATELVQHNAAKLPAHADLALITFATPGPIGYYLGEAILPGERPTIAMHTFPLPLSRYQRLFREGATLFVAGAQPQGDLLDPRIKHRSRMLWWLADHAIRQRPHPVPGAMSLLLDRPDGHILETSYANVLVVIDGTITCPLRETILDGIGLRIAEQLCRARGWKWCERPILLQEVLHDASEVILTGTVFGIAGVRRVEDREFAWPGPFTQQLLADFAGYANYDVVRQILTNC